MFLPSIVKRAGHQQSRCHGGVQSGGDGPGERRNPLGQGRAAQFMPVPKRGRDAAAVPGHPFRTDAVNVLRLAAS